MGFRICLLYEKFASMPQALWTALAEDGHDVIRPEDRGFSPRMSPEEMLGFARLVDPDVIFCPFLKQVVPGEVCDGWVTWIPHPGVRGDRGPSSISWAILEGKPTWGLTMVRARPSASAADLDGGEVGAWREFAIPPEATMASVYAQHIIPAAIACAREILDWMATNPGYRGAPLGNDGHPPAGYRPALRQDQLAFSWDAPADAILRRIRAAAFGVRAQLAGQPVHVFDGHPDEHVNSWFQPEPGQLITHRDGAVLVATGDGGAVWIGHAKRKPADGGRGLKLPAAQVVGDHLDGVAEDVLAPQRLPGQATYQPVRYRRVGQVGWIHAEPYNGAASTAFCRRLLAALQYAGRQDTTVVAVVGGPVAWNNGIHLGEIEAAADPRAEAWANIQAIDDVAEFIFTLSRGRRDLPRRQRTVAVLNSSAGAGGAVLSACFDHVLARPAINLNYHYGLMGLRGSELRSLVLPLRADADTAARLLADCLPINPTTAQRLGLVDAVGPDHPDDFHRWALDLVEHLASQPHRAPAPIDPAPYLRRELEEMRLDIFQDERGFQSKRQRFLGVAA